MSGALASRGADEAWCGYLDSLRMELSVPPLDSLATPMDRYSGTRNLDLFPSFGAGVSLGVDDQFDEVDARSWVASCQRILGEASAGADVAPTSAAVGQVVLGILLDLVDYGVSNCALAGAGDERTQWFGCAQCSRSFRGAFCARSVLLICSDPSSLLPLLPHDCWEFEVQSLLRVSRRALGYYWEFLRPSVQLGGRLLPLLNAIVDGGPPDSPLPGYKWGEGEGQLMLGPPAQMERGHHLLWLLRAGLMPAAPWGVSRACWDAACLSCLGQVLGLGFDCVRAFVRQEVVCMLGCTRVGVGPICGLECGGTWSGYPTGKPSCCVAAYRASMMLHMILSSCFSQASADHGVCALRKYVWLSICSVVYDIREGREGVAGLLDFQSAELVQLLDKASRARPLIYGYVDTEWPPAQGWGLYEAGSLAPRPICPSDCEPYLGALGLRPPSAVSPIVLPGGVGNRYAGVQPRLDRHVLSVVGNLPPGRRAARLVSAHMVGSVPLPPLRIGGDWLTRHEDLPDHLCVVALGEVFSQCGPVMPRTRGLPRDPLSIDVYRYPILGARTVGLARFGSIDDPGSPAGWWGALRLVLGCDHPHLVSNDWVRALIRGYLITLLRVGYRLRCSYFMASSGAVGHRRVYALLWDVVLATRMLLVSYGRLPLGCDTVEVRHLCRLVRAEVSEVIEHANGFCDERLPAVLFDMLTRWHLGGDHSASVFSWGRSLETALWRVPLTASEGDAYLMLGGFDLSEIEQPYKSRSASST